MKLDIGSDGRILGTKRVSTNGQVSGLSEYAGRDVLILLPGSEAPEVKFDFKDYYAEMETAVNEHLRLAFKEYKHLKEKFATPNEATKSFFKTVSPKTFHGLIDNVDTWVKDQVSATEKRIERRLEKGSNEKPAEAKATA